jgi:hypothetical protein
LQKLQQLAEAADRQYAVSEARIKEVTDQVEALTSQAKVGAQKISEAQAQSRAQADKAVGAREEVERTQVEVQKLADAANQRHAASEEGIEKLIAREEALFSQAEVTAQQLAEDVTSQLVGLSNPR